MRLALQNLARRRMRTFFAVLGIAIGIAAVVALVSLAHGFQKELDDLLVRLRGDIIVKEKDRISPQSSRIAEATVASLREVPGVAAVSGYVIQVFPFGDFRVPIYGFDPGERLITRVDIVEGRRIAETGLREIMLGIAAARNLGIRAGQTLTIPPSDPDGFELEVVGIYSTGSRYQDFGCIAHLRTLQLVGKLPGQVMMCAIDLEDPDAGVAVRDRIRDRFGHLDVQLSRDFTDSLEEYQMVNAFAWSVSAIAALVGAIGVLNTMLMSVIERTREIGMLLALGWSRGMVLRMIVCEGFLVSLIGGLAGIGIGVALVELAAEIVERLPIVPGHDLRLFGQALGLALGLGVLGSVLPAYKASRLSPVEALRHE